MQKPDDILDSNLVLDYQAGNKKALALLVRRWHKQFCIKAFFVVKDADEAKDIAQDCWRTIIDKLGSLKDPNNFSGWAMRIVYTKSIDVLRKKQNERKGKDDYKKGTSFDYEPYSERAQLKKELYNAILELPEEQRHVIQLFYLNEYSLKEIAELLNIKAGTVKSRLFHAREKLKITLKKSNYEN